MPRDYKHRAHSKRRRQPSPVAWFVAGLLVGVATFGLAWLKWAPAPAVTRAATVTPPPATEAEPSPPPRPSDAPPPRFEYYSVLPEMEVVIPPEDLRPQKPPSPPPRPSPMPELPGQSTPAAAPPAGGDAVYLLQLGSFRNTGDADRLKASLALLGITARVEKVTIDDKGTYYRVRSGPYSRDQAYGLHNRLKGNSVDSLIVRSRG